MAHPVDAARTVTERPTAGTSQSINVGSPVANTLLIVLVRFGGNPGTVTFSGYTPFIGPLTGDASDDTTIVYYRYATGSEGSTDSMSWIVSRKMAAICWEITGAADPADNPPEATLDTFTTGANAGNPDDHSASGGTLDYLWLAEISYDGENVATAGPAGYSNFITADTGTADDPSTNVVLAGATLQLTTTTENPGTFTHSGANAGGSEATIAVFPGGSEIFGQVISPFTFNRVTAGKAQKESSVVTPFSFGSVISGNVIGQHFGAVSSEFNFETTTSGSRLVTGAVNSPFSFNATTTPEAPPGEFEGEPVSLSNLSITPIADGGLTIDPIDDSGLTIDPIE